MRHEPRKAVRAPIAHANLGDFTPVEAKLGRLLADANHLAETPVSDDTLELLRRAASVLAYYIDADSVTNVEALRCHIAPALDPQPAPGKVAKPAIGNDTIREILGETVAEVVDLAIRIGWAHGDFYRPTAMTVFSSPVAAGRDSHALAVQNRILPMIGIGTGSFDSFIVNAIVELVYATHHDPSAKTSDPGDIARILKLWGCSSTGQMPLLDFAKTFELLIAHDARQRGSFARLVSDEELARAFPLDVVVQRLPHGPYDPRLRAPAGEIMGREHPEMAETLERFGYRGVIAYAEDRGLGDSPAGLKADLGRISGLTDLRVSRAGSQALASFQVKRAIAVDVRNVNHYVLTGVDETGATKRRVARHARVDRRLTVFDTVGFTDETMPEAVVLGEYATANELRRSCIVASLDDRIKPGLLSASTPGTRRGMRRLAMLSNAATIAIKRRAQAVEDLPG